MDHAITIEKDVFSQSGWIGMICAVSIKNTVHFLGNCADNF
ncbi:hypothetical Protein YC6258_02140 [Gynuella sunshinyii YC6258]|uniref:Uncharacterized protein n=1 Tax=Gynuella sunshinyii YC6258 TaxID=1445510 RepID=A0A0C5VUW2_9GAMM|nr:hypothetical Protein YC6258_02140 [Gynuella sunshinyii YC6258]